MAADQGAETAPVPRGQFRFDRVLGLLLLISLFHFVDRSLVVMAIEPIREEFGLDDFSLSLLTGAAYSVPYAMALIPLGLIADRIDRARLLTILLVLFSLATGLIGLAGSLLMLVLARMAVGAGEAGVIPASVSLLADRYEVGDRSQAFGFFFLASALGTIVSFGLGGLAIERFGWRAPFLMVAAAGLALAIALAAWLRDDRRTMPPRRRERVLAKVSPLVRQRRLVGLWLGGAFATALLVGYWAWMASFFQREFGLSVSEAGMLLAAGAGAMAGLGTYVAGAIHSRLRRARPALAQPLPALLSILSGAAVLGTVLSEQLLPAIVAFLTASLLLPMYLPITFAIGSEAVDSEGLATHAAVQQFANTALGAAIGPALVGAASAVSGSLRTGLLYLAATGVLAGASFLLIGRR